MTAPLQVIALSFSRETDAADRILAEVDDLRGRGVLRLLDMLFVAKSQDGIIERLAIGDDEDFGSLLAAVLPLPGGGAGGAESGGASGAGPAGDAVAFDTGDAGDLARSLSPGSALAFLLVEHHWAAPLFDAISQSGGTLTAEGFLTSEAQLVIGSEIAAIEESAQVIAEAQAAEADALLIAVGAAVNAADAVAASEAIQSAAAADAVRALIAAGLVEEAAAHEAVAALAAAGLMVEAADQAAAAAVAQDAAAVAAADEAADDVVAEDAASLDDVDEITGAAIAEDLATVAAADETAAAATSEAQARVKAAAITMAEAQVLRYLPEPIPFSVIADKLGISRSAAKERAERLYKRLDVHSRDEAVSRARFLGLIRG